MKMEVEQHGTVEAMADLHTLGVRASDVRPLSRKVGRIVGDSNQRRFRTRGSGSWAPLAEATQERKAREGLSPRILVATGNLERSLANPKTKKADRDELVFGTDLRYARYAGKGTKNEPKRQLSELRPAEQKQISTLVNDYVAEGRK